MHVVRGSKKRKRVNRDEETGRDRENLVVDKFAEISKRRVEEEGGEEKREEWTSSRVSRLIILPLGSAYSRASALYVRCEAESGAL